MKKSIIIFGTVFIILLLVSSATAIPVNNYNVVESKINQMGSDIESTKEFFNNILNNFQNINEDESGLSIIGFILGLLTWFPWGIIVGLILAVFFGVLGFFVCIFDCPFYGAFCGIALGLSYAVLWPICIGILVYKLLCKIFPWYP